MTSHREAYPEQYTHALVGKRVSFQWNDGPQTGVVLRVFSTRWGLLASVDSIGWNEAVAVSKLKEVA